MAGVSSGLLGVGTLDNLARQETWVHQLDPRGKLVATILFLVTVVSFGPYELVGLFPLAAFPLFLCLAGRVPFWFIGKKLLLVSPFVLALGAFNPIFDTAGRTLFGEVVVAGGWVSYLSILLRFALTMSTALALIAVTGFNSVCAGVERLGAPRIFVVQLLFLYRYLFVLGAEALRMLRAARVRGPNRRRPSLSQFGSMVGHLMLRTLDRAQRIHRAMGCRGFAGRVPRLSPMRFRATDALFVGVWAAFFASVRWLHLPEQLGRWMLGLGS